MVDLDKLTQAFPPQALKQRSGGGGKALTYVEGHSVIHRLNDATNNEWNFAIDKIERHELDANNTLVMAYVTLEIPGLGRRSHVGVQAVNARGGEDLVKGCITDALKKAATLFGVGLELYGPDYEAGEVSGQRTNDLPARDRTTSKNTVPEMSVEGALVSWAEFYTEAKRSGLANRDDCIRAGLPMDTFRNANDALAALREKLGVAA